MGQEFVATFESDLIILGRCKTNSMSSSLTPSNFAAARPTSQSLPLGDTERRIVPELVEAQAAARPDSLAVTCGAASLTYKELNDRADRLASLLISMRGSREREEVIGLCLPRSLAMIVGALGILKAGAAYLPLDSANPPERLNFTLQDARASIVVTNVDRAGEFSSIASRIVPLDGGGRVLTDEGPKTHAARRPQDLAYVIYTSGTSGRPKGVEITHASLLNLVHWHCAAFAVTSADRASHLANVVFDASVWEVWPYLCAGASVHIVDQCVLQNPERLRDWMVSERITIGFAPTPLVERMIPLDWPLDGSLRVLLTGASVLHRYPSRNLPFRLVNNYGLTECTVVSTSAEICSNGRGDSLPPIGKPIASTQVHILDERLSPVPDGTPGEIYIGGEGVARGYRNAPELTAARFVADPFSNNSHSRLYRTGDLGKLLPDGQIAFLGRIDQQVKVTGFRVEPDEIVSILNRHPSVRESVVIARECGHEKENRLIAYIVPEARPVPAAGDLCRHVKSFLPDYMIPSTFVCLESFPLTPSGKVDLAALPRPEQSNILRNTALPETGSPLEHRVAEILARLLNLEEVSLDDNFFFLGGHSLLGTQLVTRLRDVFGVDLSLKSLFDHPTVAELSHEIEQLLVAQLNAMSEEEAEKRLQFMTGKREEG